MDSADIAPVEQEGVSGQPVQKIAAKPKKRLFAKSPKKKASAPPTPSWGPPMAAPMNGGNTGGF